MVLWQGDPHLWWLVGLGDGDVCAVGLELFHEDAPEPMHEDDVLLQLVHEGNERLGACVPICGRA